MKVDIYGRGIIPGLGVLAPVYNKDLSEVEIKRILEKPVFRVYLAGGTSTKVMRKNLHSLIVMTATQGNAEKTLIPEEPKKVETPAPVVEPVEEPKEEAPVAETVEAVAEEAPAEEPVEETVAEEPKEEVKTNTSSKKKNRK